jgi:hypothetical protein
MTIGAFGHGGIPVCSCLVSNAAFAAGDNERHRRIPTTSPSTVTPGHRSFCRGGGAAAPHRRHWIPLQRFNFLALLLPFLASFTNPRFQTSLPGFPQKTPFAPNSVTPNRFQRK